MSTIVAADSGFASIVLNEAAPEGRYRPSTGPELNSSIECGEQIRNSMAKWAEGLGDLFSNVGPGQETGALPTLGVRLHHGHITTSWYQGAETLSPVIELPEGVSNLDRPDLGWRRIIQEGIPDTNLWSWLITKRQLESSLSGALRNYQLSEDSEDALHELIWTFAQHIEGQGSLNPDPIEVGKLIERVDLIDPDRPIRHSGYVWEEWGRDRLAMDI